MSLPPGAPVNVHATALRLEGAGVLIRGPSAAGKSLLAWVLLDRFAQRGQAAALVADDRVDLCTDGGGILLFPPKALAGLIELRGRGILRRSFESGVRLDLVVDLVEELERMPEEDAFRTELLGFGLPRCPVPRSGRVDLLHQSLLVEEALRLLPGQGAQKST